MGSVDLFQVIYFSKIFAKTSVVYGSDDIAWKRYTIKVVNWICICSTKGWEMRLMAYHNTGLCFVKSTFPFHLSCTKKKDFQHSLYKACKRKFPNLKTGLWQNLKRVLLFGQTIPSSSKWNAVSPDLYVTTQTHVSAYSSTEFHWGPFPSFKPVKF